MWREELNGWMVGWGGRIMDRWDWGVADQTGSCRTESALLG